MQLQCSNVYELSHGSSRTLFTQSEFVKLSTSRAAVWGGGVPEERGGAARGEGKETPTPAQITLSPYLSHKQANTFSCTHTHACTGICASRMLSQYFLSQLASSVLRALGCRQDTVSWLLRRLLAHCPQLQVSVSLSV